MAGLLNGPKSSGSLTLNLPADGRLVEGSEEPGFDPLSRSLSLQSLYLEGDLHGADYGLPAIPYPTRLPPPCQGLQPLTLSEQSRRP